MIWLLSAGLGLPPVLAQEPPSAPSPPMTPPPVASPADEAERLCAEGLKLQQESERDPKGAQAKEFLLQAIARYEAATRIEPDFYRAQGLWAICLARLFSYAANGAERQQVFVAARERFAVAEKCTGVEAALYDQWSMFLLDMVYPMATDPPSQRSVISEAGMLLEKGMKLSKNDTQRAFYEASIARAAVLLAQLTQDPAGQHAMFSRAIALYDSASREPAVLRRPELRTLWGAALFKLGQLESNPELIRRAGEQFTTQLKEAPGNLAMRYNLACVAAHLGETEKALEQLTICFERDPRNVFLANLRDDPDLAPLRPHPGFARLLQKYQDRINIAKAYKFFRDGLQAQQAAELTNSAPVIVRSLQKATALYEEAVRLQPDYYQVQNLWATCLAQLSRLEQDPARKLERALAARDRFAAAAGCTGSDAGIYEQWGALLVHYLADLQTNPAERRATLQQGREVFQKGIELGRFSGSLARLNSGAAFSCIKLTEGTTNRVEQTALYRAAIRHFEEVEKVESVAQQPELIGNWGYALFRCGQYTQDHMMIRRAVERFLAALELTPQNYDLNYNLACAYAQIGQLENSLRHLEVCLDNDTDERYRNLATTDPDLEPLRKSFQYPGAIPSRLPTTVETLTGSPISRQ